MVGIAEIGITVTSLKTALDIARTLKDLRDEAEFNSTLFELQSQILEAQSSAINANAAQAAFAEEKRNLKQEIMRLKDWSANKEQYELCEIASGATAYVKKPEMESGEAAHWLCTNCFENNQKSILQPKGRTSNRDETSWACSSCRMQMNLHWNARPRLRSAKAE